MNFSEFSLLLLDIFLLTTWLNAKFVIKSKKTKKKNKQKKEAKLSCRFGVACWCCSYGSHLNILSVGLFIRLLVCLIAIMVSFSSTISVCVKLFATNNKQSPFRRVRFSLCARAGFIHFFRKKICFIFLVTHLLMNNNE